MRIASPTSGCAKREKIMFNLNSTRQTAASLAAAFVTAMILVAAAVGPAAHIVIA